MHCAKGDIDKPPYMSALHQVRYGGWRSHGGSALLQEWRRNLGGERRQVRVYIRKFFKLYEHVHTPVLRYVVILVFDVMLLDVVLGSSTPRSQLAFSRPPPPIIHLSLPQHLQQQFQGPSRERIRARPASRGGPVPLHVEDQGSSKPPGPHHRQCREHSCRFQPCGKPLSVRRAALRDRPRRPEPLPHVIRRGQRKGDFAVPVALRRGGSGVEEGVVGWRMGQWGVSRRG